MYLKPVKIIGIILIAVAFVVLITGVFFIYQGFEVKDNYLNLDSFQTNAYVGGDAYNYIINGTYFTGYVVLGSGMLVSAVILCMSGIFMIIKALEQKPEERKFDESLPKL